MARTYQLRQRAKSEAETRRRIVEAAVHLHEEMGDARTTVSAIAERANVGRVTVYRHFPDERSLLTACTSHFFAINPPPDPAAWEDMDDPGCRLETALSEMYAFYGRAEGMLARAEQDAPANPILADLLAPYSAYLDGIRDSLSMGFANSGQSPGKIVVAAIGHALAFGTWRSLAREQGLDDDQVVATMTALVRYVSADAECDD